MREDEDRDAYRGTERRLRETTAKTRAREKTRSRDRTGREGTEIEKEGEVGGGYKVTRVQNRAPCDGSLARERTSEYARAVRPA